MRMWSSTWNLNAVYEHGERQCTFYGVLLQEIRYRRFDTGIMAWNAACSMLHALCSRSEVSPSSGLRCPG